MLRVTDAPGHCTALPWGASTEEGGDHLYSARTGITQLPTQTLGGSFRRAENQHQVFSLSVSVSVSVSALSLSQFGVGLRLPGA